MRQERPRISALHRRRGGIARIPDRERCSVDASLLWLDPDYLGLRVCSRAGAVGQSQANANPVDRVGVFDGIVAHHGACEVGTAGAWEGSDP